MTLDIKDMTFVRGEDGNLLAREVVLETLEGKPTVKVRPLTRGKLQEVQALATGSTEDKARADSVIILSGLVEPVINEETLKDIKPQFANAISMAILSESLGMTQDEISNKAEDYLSGAELELKKN